MKKKLLTLLLAIIMLLAIAPTTFFATAEPTTNDFVSDFEARYARPEKLYWPNVRWWLGQGYHTDETLAEEIKSLNDSGFGACEVLAMTASDVTPAVRYSWGSAEWSSDMQTVIKEATKNGLGASLTSGTHWGTSNLPNTYIYNGLPFNQDNPSASQILSYGQSAQLANGASFNGIIPQPGVAPAPTVSNIGARTKRFVGAVAVRVSSGTTLFAEGAIDLTSLVEKVGNDLTLNWTNDTGGPVLILTYWQHGSGQTASPSVATNYAINYMDQIGFEAVKAYWEANIFTPDLQSVITENGRIEFYMDSLELSSGGGNSGSLWSNDFEKEFLDRQGYNVLPYLHIIMSTQSGGWNTSRSFRFGNTSADAITFDKVRNDYMHVLTALYQENCLVVFRDWLHDHDITLRIEPGYSCTFEVSTPGKYVDHIENESWEFNTNPDSFRALSGSAHIYNKIYSSETGACSSNGGYRLPLDYYNQIIQQQFAVGIQRTVMHGYSSSWGPTASWPGWGPSGINSFAIYMGRRNPFYHTQDEWSMWVARNQKALRQGNPRVDLAILRTDYDMNNRLEEGYAANNNWPGLRHHEGIYWRDFALQEAGYTYEYFAPMNLSEDELYYDEQAGVVISDGPAYQAVLIYQDIMPLESAKILLDWAKKGLPIIIANDTEESVGGASGATSQNFGFRYTLAASRTPWHDGKDAELAAVMAELKALPNVIDLYPNTPGQRTGAGCSERKAPAALMSLGVLPRAQYTKGANQRFITAMRETDDELYVYLYNYQYDAKEFTQGYTFNANRPRSDTASYTETVSIDGVGKPYFFNTSSGKLTEIGVYTIENGRTIVDVTLRGGESTFVVLDKNTPDALHAISTSADAINIEDGKIYLVASQNGTYTTALSDGRTITTDVSAAPVNINLNGTWSLVLEEWQRGATLTRTEDRPANFMNYGQPAYTTTERLIDTVKVNTVVNGGNPLAELVPWQRLTAAQGVTNATRITGVGYYTTSVTLPDDWDASINVAYLSIGSINQGTAVVYVNDVKVPGGVDVCNPVKDLSAFLKPGVNEIRVEAAACNAYNQQTSVSGANVINYGMTGDTQLITYSTHLIATAADVVADIRADQSNVIVNTPVSFIVSMENAKGVGAVEVSFVFSDDVLDKDSIAVTPLNGFHPGVFSGFSLQYIGVGVWKGTVKYMYPGYVTDNNPLDIFEISGKVISTAPATVTLTGFSVQGDNGAGVGIMPGVIRTPEATINVGAKPPEYSKYDLNKDGSIDEIDLLYLIYFYQWNDRDPGWASDDLYGVFAKDCDFQVNGKVDLADMIELTANYGPYDPYAW